MRDQPSNPGVPVDSAQRTCERCGQGKPPSDFASDQATVCRRCNRRTRQFSRSCRRAAIAHLIAAHQAESVLVSGPPVIFSPKLRPLRCGILPLSWGDELPSSRSCRH
jgi:hypothetical protein